MNHYKKDILAHISYTQLVYERINKKLKMALSKTEIEEMILAIICETSETEFKKIGKNIYISNHEKNIKLTINSFTNRIITAGRLVR